MSDKPAIVYWLHTIDCTDVFTQGYVGVTTRSAKTRFREHLSKFKIAYNPYNPLHIAFLSAGVENIILTEIHSCKSEDAYSMEMILRPFDYIGWNAVQGGKLSPTVIGMIRRKRNNT
jgi:hypothetical protein